MAAIKRAAADVHRDLGLLGEQQADAISAAGNDGHTTLDFHILSFRLTV